SRSDRSRPPSRALDRPPPGGMAELAHRGPFTCRDVRCDLDRDRARTCRSLAPLGCARRDGRCGRDCRPRRDRAESSGRRRAASSRYATPKTLVHAPQDHSFPSGHAATSFAAATVLTAFAPRLAPAWFLLAVAIGFSRVYVGVHYPL